MASDKSYCLCHPFSFLPLLSFPLLLPCTGYLPVPPSRKFRSPSLHLELLRDTSWKKLHEILEPFLLRRLKADVKCLLPPKKEYLHYTPLSLHQCELYNAIVKGSTPEVLTGVHPGKGAKERDQERIEHEIEEDEKMGHLGMRF
ncbi:hypothetical protein V8E52_009134 [Russula decolorans]